MYTVQDAEAHKKVKQEWLEEGCPNQDIQNLNMSVLYWDTTNMSSSLLGFRYKSYTSQRWQSSLGLLFIWDSVNNQTGYAHQLDVRD